MARHYSDAGIAALMGYRMGSQLARDYKSESDKADLAEAMKAATTDEQKKAVEVNKPDPANYTLDSETGNYAPSLAAIQSGVSDSLSQVQEPQFETQTTRVDKQYASPADKRTAMLQAGIDFWNKKGDTDKAFELQDKLDQQSLRKLQLKGAERADRTAQKEEDYENSKRELAKRYAGNRFRVENEAAMKDYAKRLDDYQKAIKDNPDNPALAGAAPEKPSLRVMTGVDMLHDATMMMQHDMEHGKVDPVKALQYQQLLGQVKKEVGVEAFKKLHAGDIKGAIDAFEAQGDLKIPEGATIEARKGFYEVGGQKVPTNEIVVKLPNGNIQVINGLQGMDALDAAEKVVSRAFQGAELGLKGKEVELKGRELGIHEKGLKLKEDEGKRAEEKWGIEKGVLQVSADDTKAQSIARKGLIDAIESGDAKKIEVAKQKAVAAGIKFDKSQMEYTAAIDQMGNRAIITNKDTGSARVVDLSTGAVKELSGPGAPANVAFATEAEAERAKKAGTVKSGDIVTIGGRPARIN